MCIVIPIKAGFADRRAIVLCAMQLRNARDLCGGIRVDSDVYCVIY
jgi:hypothetical protein